MDFRSLGDLSKYLSSNSLLTDKSITAKIVEQAHELESMIKDEINEYYNSYSPKVYVRTYDWLNSIRVSKPEIVGSIMMIRIYFDDSMAYHPSVISDSQPDGYVPWSMESGWNIEGKIGYSAPMFTQHAGTHYLTKAVSRFNSTNPYGFRATIESGYGNY